MKTIKAIIVDTKRGVRRLDSRESYPLALKEINLGKSVLDWQISAFKQMGINNIYYVGGYHIEKVIRAHSELRFCFNHEWQTTGQLHALFCSDELLSGECIISSSNVVFRPEAIQKLLSSGRKADEHGCVLGGFYHSGEKDCCRINAISTDGAGCLNFSGEKLVSVGGSCASAANGVEVCTFADLCYLSKREAELLSYFYRKAQQQGQGREFYSAASFAEASLLDLFAFMLELNHEIGVTDIGGHVTRINDAQSLAYFVFGTKAQTLKRLQPRISSATILDQVCFTVADWQNNQDNIISEIQKTITTGKIIIRSSALAEDTWEKSNAGMFHSELAVDIDDPLKITEGIERVIESYKNVRNKDGSDQLFVQPHVSNVTLSGVMFTRDIETGAPYYIVSFSTGSRTDTVTSGASGGITTIRIYREAADSFQSDFRVRHLLALAKELEHMIGFDALDIEFAFDDKDCCFLFQVRPITAVLRKSPVDDRDIAEEISAAKDYITYLTGPNPFLYGTRNVLANMPDWNPAEIVGTKPRPLALSLYQYLITDKVWAKSRAAMGYKKVEPVPLVVSIVDSPYVDARASFNSFLPEQLSPELSAKLVTYYIDLLRSNPELHDKVEFEIALTCHAFDFDVQAIRLTNAGFSKSEIDETRGALLDLTDNIICGNRLSIEAEMGKVEQMARRRQAVMEAVDYKNYGSVLASIRYLLDDCKSLGTLPFANLARCGFIAMIFLKTMVTSGVLTEEGYHECLRLIPTVATNISESIEMVKLGIMTRETFLEEYGHLRPGTYDLLSPRYDEAPDTYLPPRHIGQGTQQPVPAKSMGAAEVKAFFKDKLTGISDQLARFGFRCDAERLCDFICKSIPAREMAKFEFSKNISESLRLISRYAALSGITNDGISFIPIRKLLDLSVNNQSVAIRQELTQISNRNRKRFALSKALSMPDVIISGQDLDFFYENSSRPNFITSGQVAAEVAVLSETREGVSIKGKIVLIENADPGYDWIFAHNIAGIITKYGGIASHMAIRAAEFALPSAIGCGEVLFERFRKAKRLEINCASKQIHLI